jgi:hypothetical protein
MAHSYSEQIRINEKNIAQTKENLANNYKSLGKNIALFVCDNSFSYCLRELSSYEIAKGEYKRLLNKKNKLKSKVDTLDDNNNEIYYLRKSLTEQKQEEIQHLSKFGAALYEAYSNKILEQEIIKKLDPIFLITNEKITKYKEKIDKKNIVLSSAFYENILNRQRKILSNLFITAAQFIIDEKLEKQITINNSEKYIKTLQKSILKRENLEKKIESCESTTQEINDEDEQSPLRKLDEINKQVDISKAAENEAATLLGEELYMNLPNNITSKQIGPKAISLIDNITLELAKIESLEQDIVKLNNRVVITELSSQIAHERSKVTKLEDEIVNCNKQINKIDKIINIKRNKIIELKNAGTYEKSALDLITLDDTDGNA